MLLSFRRIALTFLPLPRWRLLMRRIVRVILIVLAVLVVLVLVAPFLIPVNQFRPTIEEKASAALGRKADVGNLSLSLFTGSLAADNLSIADDPKYSKSPFLTAKSVKVGVELLPLIMSKDLKITGITIDSPKAQRLRQGQPHRLQRLPDDAVPRHSHRCPSRRRQSQTRRHRRTAR